MDLESQLQLSYYREIALLNENHRVWLVQHTETQKIYVKKALEVYDLQVYRYLQQNPQPGIPRIFQLIQGDGPLFVIEEYISGRSLKEILEEKGTLPVPEAISTLFQLCGILRPLHALSPPIIHRDIKPSNLILTPQNQLFLVDFNAAKAVSPGKGQDTVLIGTAGYAAPEQYGFSPSQPTADIYALGVLLHEMLTGRLPSPPTYQGPLAPVINKCLAMEPSRRFQSVDELARALHRRWPHHLEGQSGRRSWLPPGLRSGRLWRISLGVLWYLLLLSMCSSIQLKEGTRATLIVFRTGTFLIFLFETLWLGNYRNIWSKFPFCDRRRPWICLIAVSFWAFLLLVGMLLLIGLILPR